MVDAHVSGACVERRAGSTPVLGTKKTSNCCWKSFLFSESAETIRGDDLVTLLSNTKLRETAHRRSLQAAFDKKSDSQKNNCDNIHHDALLLATGITLLESPERIYYCNKEQQPIEKHKNSTDPTHFCLP